MSLHTANHSFLKLAAVAFALFLAPGVAVAQAYPSKPVHYVVPYPVGGSPDMTGRLLAEHLSRMWGQQVVVDNRAGAGGTLGATVAAKAAPDGYTLFQCNIASNAIASSLYEKLQYDPRRDFAPITRIGTTPNGIIVHPSLPTASVAEFIAYAKANPGKLSYGTSGVGSSGHLAMELLKTLTRIDVVHVAYKGAAPALVDLLGGQIMVNVSNVPALISPVKAGRVRALAVTGAKRSAQLPAVPTMIESGIADFDVTSWYGVCAPAGTPRTILEKLHADITRVLMAPEVNRRLTDMVIDVAPTSREDFGAFMRAETSRWERVAKNAGIVPQ
jgi:tripartite-type tricarboxylate transporter receptor subunit TctC